jgi:hypothetical protein
MPWDIQKNNYPSNCNRSIFICFFHLILDAPRTSMMTHSRVEHKHYKPVAGFYSIACNWAAPARQGGTECLLQLPFQYSKDSPPPAPAKPIRSGSLVFGFTLGTIILLLWSVIKKPVQRRFDLNKDYRFYRVNLEKALVFREWAEITDGSR